MSMLIPLCKQIYTRPPCPTADFTGQTIIVTGANAGLGKEACKHFAHLNATRIIATVRTLARGKDALAEIEAATGRTGVVELWELDYGKHDSLLAFGERARRELTRLDKVVLNAGIATETWGLLERHESSISVNVISTALLSLLLLPVLRASKERNGGDPYLEIVCSSVHSFARFKERKGKSIFATLDDERSSDMSDRYQTSKLIQLFATREIAKRTAHSSPPVTINNVDPGFCYTDLLRNAEGSNKVMINVMRALFAWTAEEGSRTLVHGTVAGKESHGVFMSVCAVDSKTLSPFVTSPEGVETQERIWAELKDILEEIQPGVTAVLEQ
ncbi:MAG: hypothetical protein M1818_003025 [Claussenomyces sp. TS43310]|nr:MAG: hypothetical protein M1818_003025 [Claussenomyces sp. TS43310]